MQPLMEPHSEEDGQLEEAQCLESQRILHRFWLALDDFLWASVFSSEMRGNNPCLAQNTDNAYAISSLFLGCPQTSLKLAALDSHRPFAYLATMTASFHAEDANSTWPVLLLQEVEVVGDA